MFKMLSLNRFIPKIPLQKYFSSCCEQGRHRYHEEIEKGINDQIVRELNAGYTYLSMAMHFGRSGIALPGCHAFFMKMYLEEQEHALKFMNYQNMRGGSVELCSISVNNCDQDCKSICNAFTVSLNMEKSLKEQLENFYNLAENHKDLTTADFISSTFIPEQDRSICEISHLLTRATKMVENGAGEFLFDKSLHDAYVLKDKCCKAIGVSETYK